MVVLPAAAAEQAERPPPASMPTPSSSRRATMVLYANRVLGSVNRSNTTDFAAPAENVPTFRRTFAVPTGTTNTTAGSPTDHLTFTQVGTSMSAAIVTGSYALVSSALNYWITLARSNGYTADAYLNTKVGTDSLTFGRHAFKNLSAWNNPSGINGILAWTAVPATDANDGGSLSTPPTLFGGQSYRNYASINVANAIASVEGYVAINYLFAHHDWGYIDTNHDGLVTASEVQTFQDNASAMGLPEAGAMASWVAPRPTAPSSRALTTRSSMRTRTIRPPSSGGSTSSTMRLTAS